MPDRQGEFFHTILLALIAVGGVVLTSGYGEGGGGFITAIDLDTGHNGVNTAVSISCSEATRHHGNSALISNGYLYKEQGRLAVCAEKALLLSARRLAAGVSVRSHFSREEDNDACQA